MFAPKGLKQLDAIGVIRRNQVEVGGIGPADRVAVLVAQVDAAAAIAEADHPGHVGADEVACDHVVAIQIIQLDAVATEAVDRQAIDPAVAGVDGRETDAQVQPFAGRIRCRPARSSRRCSKPRGAGSVFATLPGSE